MARSKKVLFLLTLSAFFFPCTFDPTPASSSQDKGALSQDQKILHVLTRPTFGPRSEEHTSELQSQR